MRLVGVTELSRMLGANPNLAPLVLEGMGRWEAGTSAGGMDPQRKGWGRLQDRGGDDQQQQQHQQHQQQGEDTPHQGPQTPPPRPPRKNPAPATSRVATKRRPPPPPKGSRASPSPRPSRGPRARAKPPPPPPNPRPPLCKKGAGTPMGMCRVWGTPGMSLGRRGLMGGPSAK